tara:strand:+ start:4897 stop:6168 length:1272 start_codon:yes stop_codon:yes gene_type:complete
MKKTLLFCFLFSISQPQNLFVDGVAAVVEDKIVLKSDLNQMVNMMAVQNKIDPNNEPDKYLGLQKAVLGSMVDQKILLELAEEDTTIEVSEKEVEQALDLQVENIIRQAGGKDAAEKMLNQSIKSFRSEFWFEMKDKIISEKFQQKVLSKIRVSKKDVFAFFETYKDSLPVFPTEAKIRHLLITPTASDSAKKETVSLLEEITEKIKKGESFSKLASSFSMDPGSKKKGGDLGWVSRGSLLKNFEEVVFTIKTNTVSRPIETEVGYHILEVFERKGDRARVRHILITPQISKKDEKKAFDFAVSLKDSCSSLALFKAFTKKYSNDTQTSQIGGDLGWINPKTYPVEEIGLALQIIKERECSLPINTSFGFHLLWLEKIRPGGQPNLKSHWPKIEEMSLNNKKMVWYEKWIKKEKEKFFIKVLN